MKQVINIYNQPSLFGKQSIELDGSENVNYDPLTADWNLAYNYNGSVMDKVVIFGVTGQDGSYLADELLKNGYKVIGVTRRCSTNNKQNLELALENPKFSLVEGDITDPYFVQNLLSTEKPAFIYNLAAMSHVGTSFKQPNYTFQVIALGSLNILSSIKTLKDSTGYNPRYYHASTSEMFGDKYSEADLSNLVNNGLIDKAKLIDSIRNMSQDELKFQNESTPFNPQSPYAVAKLAAHLLGCIYRQSYGMFICNGILFNHCSVRRGENFVTRKITKYIGKLKADKQKGLNITNYPKLKLGNLSAYRDFGYAPEYCDAMILMLNNPTPDDYVICTSETHTVEEFLVEAFKYAGFEDYTNFVEIDQSLFRPSEVDFLKGSYQKAKEVLGWEPKTKFLDLVHIMVDYDYKESL